jgi:ornithine carbamoyltransferase
MIRTFEQQDVEDLAKYGTIPVINGLTDYAHPCQVLADLMTVKEYKKSFDGLKLCFIGDGFNMANSLIVGGLTVGMDIAVASPSGYEVEAGIRAFGDKYPGKLTLTNDPKEAAKGADVLITDVWYSMGQSDIEERKIIFKDYIIDDKLMKHANNDAMVLHCLPAHRDEEISSGVFAAHEHHILDESENRLHVQKAVMVKLIGEI